MQQNIHFEALAACGESCTGCPKKEQGLCGGCRETDGYCQEWADTGRCPIHACAREHEALFCGLCRHFPCQRLPGLLPWKPEAETQLAALAAAYRLQNRPARSRMRECADIKVRKKRQNFSQILPCFAHPRRGMIIRLRVG